MPAKHVPTDETRAQVYALSSFGVTQDDIGRFIGVSDDTLRKWYSAELDRASVDRNAEVAAFLFRSANGSAIAEGASYSDCLKAAMFWLKTRAQWRERHEVDHTSSDGSLFPTRIIIEAATPQDADHD
jgi:transposase-like protein